MKLIHSLSPIIFCLTFLTNAQNTASVDASDMQNGYANVFETPTNANPVDKATLGSDVVEPKVLSTNDKEPIKLYAHPNPVQSVWNLRASENITGISLKNTLGQNVYNVAPNTLYWSVDMSQLKAGVYKANVSIGGSSTSIKLVKE